MDIWESSVKPCAACTGGRETGRGSARSRRRGEFRVYRNSGHCFAYPSSPGYCDGRHFPKPKLLIPKIETGTLHFTIQVVWTLWVIVSK